MAERKHTGHLFSVSHLESGVGGRLLRKCSPYPWPSRIGAYPTPPEPDHPASSISQGNTVPGLIRVRRMASSK